MSQVNREQQASQFAHDSSHLVHLEAIDSSEAAEGAVDWRGIAYAIGVFVTGGIILFGIAGNVLSCWILLKSGRKTSMYCIMEALCVSDTIILTTNLAFQILPNLKDRFEQFYAFYYIYGQMAIIAWPISFAAQMTTVWLIVLISAERWFAVCQPLLTAKHCSYKRTRLTCYGVFFFSLLYCSPRFFEYTLCLRLSSEYYSQLESANATGDESARVGQYDERSSVPFCESQENGTGYSLHKNVAFGTGYVVVYCAILYFLIVFLIPIVLIAVLNISIIMELRRSKETWAQLSRIQKKEQKITKLPICIVVLFLICGAPALAVNVLDAAQIHPGSHWDLMITVGNLLIMVNSATNFIIYCVVGKEFRQAIIYLFLRKQRPRSASSLYSSRYAGSGNMGSAESSVIRRNSNTQSRKVNIRTDVSVGSKFLSGERKNSAAPVYVSTPPKYITVDSKITNADN